MGKQWKLWETLFLGAPKSLQMVTAAITLRHLLLGRKAMTNLGSILNQRHRFSNKGLSSQRSVYGFSNSPVWIWELDYKESWAPKNLILLNCRAGEALRVPWTAKRSNQSILKEISPDYSLEQLMLKLKPVLWQPDAKNWFIWKDPDAGKDWKQEGKGMTEDEMVGWYHRLNGHEFE